MTCFNTIINFKTRLHIKRVLSVHLYTCTSRWLLFLCCWFCIFFVSCFDLHLTIAISIAFS
ncbi:hypothetical protein CW304_05260 [Bacillus sp. UFRGS-B20]|nr:hypothetical protein CW304_05260 [Bacillus sp. UFRGS-B20]